MKKPLSYLLIIGLLASKLTVFQVNAAELNPEQSKESEIDVSINVDDTSVESAQQTEQEVNIEENAISETLSDSEYIQEVNEYENTNREQSTSINKPIDLKWNPDKPGSFSFNKNGSEGDNVYVEVYKDGISNMGYFTGISSNTEIYEGDISHMINESGDYTFRVFIYSGEDHNNTDYVSDISEVFHYILPEQKVESPMNVTWDNSNIGLITWGLVDHAKEYLVVITNDNFQSNIIKGIKKYDVAQEDFSEFIKPGFTYKAKVMAYSNNINLYAHSDYSVSEEFCFQSNSNEEGIEHIIFDSVSDKEDNNSPSIPSFWIPTTDEEQLRYSCFGKENIQYTTSNNQPYNINIQNAMQGEKCFEVFKNIANDYTIARTYNIYPLESETKYTTNNKVTISLTIPEALHQKNREFKMICVSQNGVPYIFADQDKDPKTITFSTDKFYAFALIYKDAK